MALLARESVGRVAFVLGALPEIVPVNFVLADQRAVIGVHNESMLARIEDGTVVALQVDCFDVEHETGWHVRAFGTCWWTADPVEVAVAGGLPPRPWTAGGDPDRVLEVLLSVVSGYEVAADRVDDEDGLGAARDRLP